METFGIIAGSGELPFVAAREARQKGRERIVAIGFEGQTDPALERDVDAIHWIHVGQLGKLIKLFQREGVGEAVMVGKLEPNLVIRKLRLDMRLLALAARVRSRGADAVLKAVIEEIEKEGITIVDSSRYLGSVIVPCGVLSKRPPGREEEEDIRFGLDVAREIARRDIGQAVVVKEKAVIAVEAMEGTDRMLARAGELCDEGMVVVKVSRPHQDMRFDLPVVGYHTVAALAEHRAAVLAMEADRTILLNREQVIETADRAGIAIVGC